LQPWIVLCCKTPPHSRSPPTFVTAQLQIPRCVCFNDELLTRPQVSCMGIVQNDSFRNQKAASAFGGRWNVRYSSVSLVICQ
jgi:hypothetical protein